jgi:hypothetical protein
MGFIDAIGTGIGKIALLILGLFIIIVGFAMFASKLEVLGFIVLIIGIGVMVGAKSYSR